jgi:uncharacterized protein (TIGR00730 family)
MSEFVSVCVYCGSSNFASDRHKAEARRLGRILAERGIRLVFGGGRVGLMDQVATSAMEAGGAVVGIIPDFLDAIEVGNREITDLQIVPSMHERKMRMCDMADAFVVLPGGFGTMDETFEILTWKQLGLHDKPIVLVNFEGYWTPLLDLFAHMIENRYARRSNLDLFVVVERVDEVLDAIARAPAPTLSSDAARL